MFDFYFYIIFNIAHCAGGLGGGGVPIRIQKSSNMYVCEINLYLNWKIYFRIV